MSPEFVYFRTPNLVAPRSFAYTIAVAMGPAPQMLTR
jgi:hypothetical protein